MNKHILNGNRKIAEIKTTKDTTCIGSALEIPTHFRTKEDLAPIINEFSLALNDALNETAQRIVLNRLKELEVGLINMWIHDHYA